jgi:VCBS repeat-containing protein
VNAVSSDPTAVLTLNGYGPAAAATPGVSVSVGAGTGLDLVGTAAQVIALKAPPSTVQVSSTKGGSVLRKVDTAHGIAQLVGSPSAINDSATINEDCSAVSAVSCAAGQGVTVDLLANDTVMLNGVVSSLRDVVSQNLATVTVTAQAPALGSATVSVDGILTYTPNPNANGTDNVIYTVTVDGQASNQAVVAITITPVNDTPVAANQTIGAVTGRAETMNLLAGATDPDGPADVKDAVLTTWPAQLGVQPTPVNGVISFTPAATGNFTFNFSVKDSAGVLSANVATGTVTAIANETISFIKTDYTVSKKRWVVTGTDTVRANQELSIVYSNGVTTSGQNCGAALVGGVPLAACVLGKVTIDAAGAFLFDFAATTNGVQDPRGNQWSTRPTNIRAFSSAPVLGGTTASTAITFR